MVVRKGKWKSSPHVSEKITVVYVFSLVTWNPRSDSPSSALEKSIVNADRDSVHSSWIKND
jgi:hypothetical protein